MWQNLIDQFSYAGYEEALRQGLKPISGQWDVSSELALAQNMTKKLQLTKTDTTAHEERRDTNEKSWLSGEQLDSANIIEKSTTTTTRSDKIQTLAYSCHLTSTLQRFFIDIADEESCIKEKWLYIDLTGTKNLTATNLPTVKFRTVSPCVSQFGGDETEDRLKQLDQFLCMDKLIRVWP